VPLDGFIEDDRGNFDFTDPDDDVFAFITADSAASTVRGGTRTLEGVSPSGPEQDPGSSGVQPAAMLS
jgi:hypothetical protein